MSGTVVSGREVDVAVALAMGIQPREVRIAGSTATVTMWTDNKFFSDGHCSRHYLEQHAGPPPYSTDDATALRWCVPWLRERDYEVTHTHEIGGRVIATAYPVHEGKIHSGRGDGDHALAAALCQVVRAVAGMGETA